MRKLLTLGAAAIAMLSLVSIAQGINSDDESHIWFFGDCQNPYDSPDFSDADSGGGSFFGSACRGIGLFLGDEPLFADVAYDHPPGYRETWLLPGHFSGESADCRLLDDLWALLSTGKRMDFDPEILVRLAWRNQPMQWLPTKVHYPLDGLSHFRLFHDNALISGMHTKLFFGMLLRLPSILWRRWKA